MDAVPNEAIFFSDVQRKHVTTGLSMPDLMPLAPSSPSEPDEDEEVLFAGRQAKMIPKKMKILNDSLRSSSNAPATNGSKRSNDELPLRAPIDSAKATHSSRKQRSVAADEVMSDYITNVSANESIDTTFAESSRAAPNLAGFDGGHSDSDLLEPASEVDDEWSSADLRDLDDLSTSSGGVETIGKVLSRRERPSGLQYLVAEKGMAVDDARWLSLETLAKSRESARLVQLFEEKKAFLSNSASEGVSDSDLDEDEIIERDVQQTVHESYQAHQFEERRKYQMTDERIARLLSKQEQLGMGSNELFLFDVDVDDPMTNRTGCAAHRPQSKRNAAGKARQERKPRRLSDTVLRIEPEEPFAGLYAMQTHIPRKAKGRRRELQLDLSDSELNQRMQESWANDRVKKTRRKKEREQLRQQGLLGKGRKDKPDLRVKYANSISIQDLKDELRCFLASTSQNLALPPMNPCARKLVHEIGHNLGLNSKSMGQGPGRYPNLYKTSRTRAFDDVAFEGIRHKIMPRSSKGRKEVKGKRQKAPVAKQPGRLGLHNHYQEGEVVGASAPELGEENKGRAMLEKMGWSTGTGLGAINNKGIPLPVAQIVKTTRAGLG
ncbi:uncharacterized protein KY384_005898 [Bacidia gigantensis]|uniref:uncharacterized protein n=1 Tax=Bacidia gigantensis TaxID=2732470 RepID=UPI001D059E50|nr:uncharacterized protein KY384_005898 [Bacidia gigantensis]KAG8529263.1 hypothetical protein KY384_005898 [Bacidia gigantensis]